MLLAPSIVSVSCLVFFFSRLTLVIGKPQNAVQSELSVRDLQRSVLRPSPAPLTRRQRRDTISGLRLESDDEEEDESFDG